MASMYDSVTPGGMIDTVFGNYKPGQKKGATNALIDGAKTVASIPGNAYRQANDLTNKYFVNPVLAPAASAAATGISNTMAERRYADEHNGEYPPSPEAFSAYKSFRSNSDDPLNGPGPNNSNFQTNPGMSSQYENGLLTAPPAGSIPTTLGLGNDDPAAVQAQTAQAKATVEAKNSAHAQKTAIANGYTPTPDASADPVGFMAATNMNKAKGVGDSTGTMNPKAPAPPTDAQQQAIALNETGKKAAFDMSKAGPWYKSQSFNYGLISFGLNLLSGNDLATSFGAAGQAFGDMYGQEQRGAWAQDLQNQGYSPQEIEEYVRTGNSKALTDPMEKQARQVQLQTNLQQLDNLQYSNSPEQRQAALDDKAFDKNIKLATLDNQRAATAGAAADRRESMQLRRDALNFKMQGGGADQQPLLYTDTNGKAWEVQRNARGTPLVNANGMAVVRDTETGQTAWRNVSDNARQMGGIQANEGLAAMDEVQSADLMQYTGNSLVAKGNRRVRDELGGNVSSDLNSHFENINGAVRATLETQLMQENNNRPVQKNMLDTAVKRLGRLDINNSPEENARIMGNYRSVLTSQYNARDETHPSVSNRDYQDPGNRPGVKFDNTGSTVGGRAMPRMGQRVGGMTYIGGDPSKQSSWAN